MSTTNDFLADVRGSRIAQPTQITFSAEEWTTHFSLVARPTATDRRLHHAGLWIADRLAETRSEAEAIGNGALTSEELARLAVGFLNRMGQALQAGSLGPPPNQPVLSSELLQARVDLGSGRSATPDHLITSALDGAVFPLRHASKGQKRSSHSKGGDSNIFKEVYALINLGARYEALDTAWGHILWNGYKLDESGTTDVIRPPAERETATIAVSQSRWLALKSEAMMHCLSAWAHMMEPADKLEILNRVRSARITGSGRSRKILVGRPPSALEHPPESVVARTLGRAPYYDEITKEPLPALAGGSLEQLLDAWDVLASIASDLRAKSPSPEHLKSGRGLVRWCPTISRLDLERAIAMALTISGELARALIEFLTFRSKPSAELWSTPLVPAASQRLAIVFSAVLEGNLERNVEKWLNRSGLDIAVKGPLFEREMRAYLAEKITSSPLLRASFVHPSELEIRGSGGTETIDLAIWLPGTLLVGELKCLFMPTEPIEVHRYLRRVDEAAAQAARKAKFLEDHILEVVEKLGRGALDRTPRIQPFVLVNHPFGVGTANDGVPVVDKLILGAFLGAGHHNMFVQEDGATGKRRTGHRVTFYQSEAEAAQVVGNYLNSPPQLRTYREHLVTERYPLLPQTQSRRAASIESLEVKIPSDLAATFPGLQRDTDVRSN